MLYPSTWRQSAKHQGIGLPAFTVWLYLVSGADDDGVGPLIPADIASGAFLLLEGRARTLDEVEDYLATLVSAGLVQDYLEGRRRYYAIHDFRDHQWVRARDYKATTYPTPEEWRPGVNPRLGPETVETSKEKKRREYREAMDRERESRKRAAAATSRPRGMPEHVKKSVEKILGRKPEPQEAESE